MTRSLRIYGTRFNIDITGLVNRDAAGSFIDHVCTHSSQGIMDSKHLGIIKSIKNKVHVPIKEDPISLYGIGE